VEAEPRLRQEVEARAPGPRLRQTAGAQAPGRHLSEGLGLGGWGRHFGGGLGLKVPGRRFGGRLGFKIWCRHFNGRLGLGGWGRHFGGGLGLKVPGRHLSEGLGLGGWGRHFGGGLGLKVSARRFGGRLGFKIWCRHFNGRLGRGDRYVSRGLGHRLCGLVFHTLRGYGRRCDRVDRLLWRGCLGRSHHFNGRLRFGLCGRHLTTGLGHRFLLLHSHRVRAFRRRRNRTCHGGFDLRSNPFARRNHGWLLEPRPAGVPSGPRLTGGT
jgi:hypothetical protein